MMRFMEISQVLKSFEVDGAISDCLGQGRGSALRRTDVVDPQRMQVSCWMECGTAYETSPEVSRTRGPAP